MSIIVDGFTLEKIFSPRRLDRAARFQISDILNCFFNASFIQLISNKKRRMKKKIEARSKRKLKKDNNRRQQQRHVRLSYWPTNGQTPRVYLYREVTIDNVPVLHIIETQFAIIVLLLLRNSLSSARLDTRNSLS